MRADVHIILFCCVCVSETSCLSPCAATVRPRPVLQCETGPHQTSMHVHLAVLCGVPV